MSSSIKIVSDNINFGEIMLGDTSDKYANVPGAYAEIYYSDASGKGLDPGVVYDPAIHKNCLAITNTAFSNSSFEVISRLATNKLNTGATLTISFCEDGVEVKRRTVTAGTYWFYVTNGKFEEALRLMME